MSSFECNACGHGVCKLITDDDTDLPENCVYDAGLVPEWREIKEIS